MTDLRKAAELALEALRNAEVVYMEQLNAMYALQEALAQPEQEPVAGMFEEKLPDQNPPPWSRSYRLKRDWVGLTDEEVKAFKQSCHLGGIGYDTFIKRFAIGIEAKLKEKNGG